MSFTASSRALGYLEEQQELTLTKLHQQPSTALAIFRRMLPHLAKTIVMAMLYMPQPLSLIDLESWIEPSSESRQAKDRALDILQRLKILEEETGQGQIKYRMSKIFAKSLRLALTGGGSHNSFGIPCSTPDPKHVGTDFLDAYARRQWESILYYVVGSAGAGLGGQSDISDATKRLLQRGGFVSMQGRHALITQTGFTFLLQEVNAQIWQLLIEYLRLSPDLQMDAVEMLSFLFTLGSLELGIDYSTTNLTSTQQQMLEDLTHFGLTYRHDATATRYYPTRLATTLTSDAPALPNSSLTSTTVSLGTVGGISADDKGFVIVETNYRLYAYTNSPLLISILSLFCQLHTRYPNLVTGKITKSSIQSAISRGITADQIVTYLTTHAHPVMRKQQPILPPTVVDQIRLWQIEGERMTAWEGYWIKDVGGSMEDYDKAVQYAEALGILIRDFRSKRCFFVSRMEQLILYFGAQVARRKKAQEEAKAAAAEAGKT